MLASCGAPPSTTSTVPDPIPDPLFSETLSPQVEPPFTTTEITPDETPSTDDQSALGTLATGRGSMKPLSLVWRPLVVGDIKNRAAAVRLGKALFWDVQVGGDGKTACATCHFQSGADARMTNTINPGPNGIFESVPGPGHPFGFEQGSDFPNESDLEDHKPPKGDDVVGSQGVAHAILNSVSLDPNNPADNCTPVNDPVFGTHRRVTGRNTPPVIGAVFNRENFWDGRAHHQFNGLNPFGTSGNNVGGSSLQVLQNASVLSQVVGPPNNDVEMSCVGRLFNKDNTRPNMSLAEKMIWRQPLAFQAVSSTDSVLNELSAAPANGLKCRLTTNGPVLACTYRKMIEAAFGSAVAANAEYQFSSIFGQAIAAYEATLVASDTPFDRFLAGNNNAMNPLQKAGFDVFRGKGNCIICHAGSELSDATASFAQDRSLKNTDGGDQGFHNIGVRPTSADLGRAGSGPGSVSFSVSASSFDRGAFKTPQLRNIRLTAPYFHDGSAATLHDVVDFYEHGGRVGNPEMAREMANVRLSTGDHDSLEAFLRDALTDCRTLRQAAPFDHPSLPLPNSNLANETLPATGRDGLGGC